MSIEASKMLKLKKILEAACAHAIRPKYIAGTYGDILDDFRKNVTLTPAEMDEIITNHHFTREGLAETHRLLKILWNYQLRSSTPKLEDP